MTDGPGIADLAWLTGTWRAEIEGDLVEEIWGEPLGTSLAGVFRWMQGSDIHLYELLVVEADDAGLPVLRIRHFWKRLEAWTMERDTPMSLPLASLEGRRAVFEHATYTFPRRIVYERVDDDTLVVRVEGKKAEGPVDLVFRFRAHRSP